LKIKATGKPGEIRERFVATVERIVAYCSDADLFTLLIERLASTFTRQ
jgi:hypothetical protein